MTSVSAVSPVPRTPRWQTPALVIAAACVIALVGFGARSIFGLFLEPMTTARGWGRETFALALAVQNLLWGMAVPVAGALSDRFGPTRVMAAGALVYAAGIRGMASAEGAGVLLLTAGVLVGIGVAFTAFSIALAAMAQVVGPARRSLALGLGTAAGSAGQVVFSPLGQAFISGYGWSTALVLLSASTLLIIPLAWLLPGPPDGRRREADAARPPDRAGAADPVDARGPAAAGEGLAPAPDRVRAAASESRPPAQDGSPAAAGQRPTPAPAVPRPPAAQAGQPLSAALREAVGHRGYGLLTAGFFVCGFHVAFITVHFPAYVRDLGLPAAVGAGAIAIIGLFNIIGSLASGAAGQRWSKTYGLSVIYALRAVAITALLLAPKTTGTIYAFAAAMGLLWLSTVPLTTGVVGQIFGVRYLATLFGVVFLSHQVGSFLGVWLGGWLHDATGSYDAIWWAGVVLGLAAAAIHLPIDDRPLARPAAPAPASH